MDGGRWHGMKVPWDGLQPPYADVERAKAKRLVLYKLPLAALLAAGGESADWADPEEDTRVWRLFLHRRGSKVLLAQAERPIEGASLEAAAASIAAVFSERADVLRVPSVHAQFARCSACDAPLVPDDTPEVSCPYCGKRVPLPENIRAQAAGVKALEGARARTNRRVARLLGQAGPTRFNVLLLVATFLMVAAWPLGWSLITKNVLLSELRWLDAAFVPMPLLAVLGGFFFVRAWIADRGALRLLALGYGALAPARRGEPSTCRRCHGPLPSAGLGGIVQCRYCSSENIAGMDLRPVVDSLRGQHERFDEPLKQRRRERVLWSVLALVSLVAMGAWAGATVAYARERPTLKDRQAAAAPPSRAPEVPAVPAAAPPAPAPTPAAKQFAALGGLTIVCVPKCDQILDNGSPLGPGPVHALLVPAGRHDLRLSAPNGVKKSVEVEVVAGRQREVRVPMAP